MIEAISLNHIPFQLYFNPGIKLRVLVFFL